MSTTEQTLRIRPGRLAGTVCAPPSKSAAHRAAICAALASGVSTLRGIERTEDMAATMKAAQALGARCNLREGILTVEGISSPAGHALRARIDCNESGSTLRFFVPIAAALGAEATFTGRGKLPQRPMAPLTEAMGEHGVRFSSDESEILTTRGQLRSGRYVITGSVSSQYVTGLLFALPLLPGDSEIVLTSPLQSAGYVDMTLQMMGAFGVKVEQTAGGYHIPGGQRYAPREIDVEGDYSGAAFWLCAAAAGSEIGVRGLRADSLQGDKRILSILEQMGAQVDERGGEIRVTARSLRGVRIDVSDVPDLVPALAALAIHCEGVTAFVNAARLRLKECDRLACVNAGLTALGAQVEEGEDYLKITGAYSLAGGVTVSGCDDHRIAMAMTIASLGCREPVTITGAQCVAKSYPGFYQDFTSLGGVYHVL